LIAEGVIEAVDTTMPAQLTVDSVGCHGSSSSISGSGAKSVEDGISSALDDSNASEVASLKNSENTEVIVGPTVARRDPSSGDDDDVTGLVTGDITRGVLAPSPPPEQELKRTTNVFDGFLFVYFTFSNIIMDCRKRHDQFIS
jgi:hypothetical protein